MYTDKTELQKLKEYLERGNELRIEGIDAPKLLNEINTLDNALTKRNAILLGESLAISADTCPTCGRKL